MDFDYLGIQTLYDRYLVVDKTGQKPKRLETPQLFWMRVAMGVFAHEDNPKIRLFHFTICIKAVASVHLLLPCSIREPLTHNFLPVIFTK